MKYAHMHSEKEQDKSSVLEAKNNSGQTFLKINI